MSAGDERMKSQSKARLVRMHFGENDKWQGKPLYESIVQKCHDMGIAGATVYRGVEGYGGSTLVHGRHLFVRSSDAPVVVTVVDTEENIDRLMPALAGMVDGGLIAISDVEVIRYDQEKRG